jgi:hypothetical protein
MPGLGNFPSGVLDPADDEPIVDGVEHDNDMSLALVPNIGAELAAVLAEDPDPEVRAAVATNSSCSAATDATLASDPEPTVRAALLRSGRVDVDDFVDDPSPSVLSEVALRTSDASIRATLATHPVPGVRAGVAANPSSTVSEVRRLVGDADEHVSSTAVSAAESRGIRVAPTVHEVALSRDETAAAIAEGGVAHVNAVLAGDVTDAELDAAAASDDASLRAAAAGHPRLGAERVVVLAGDVSPNVRRAVAVRDGLAPELQVALAADPVPQVRRPVLLNGDAPERLDAVEVAELSRLGVDQMWDRLEVLAGDGFVDAVAAAPSWSGTLAELGEVYSLTA